MLDADGLKGINDMYGHHMGDVYLRQIGRQIEFSGEKRFISARMGGENFRHFFMVTLQRRRQRRFSGTLRLIAARFLWIPR